MSKRPLIHYVFRHAIGMVQMNKEDNLGAIERVFVETDPRQARKAALSFYTMYCDVLHQTEEFNKRMELEEYVRSLHGHPTADVVASRAWKAGCDNSEIGCGCIEEDTTKTDPLVVMIVDGELTDTGQEVEVLIKGEMQQDLRTNEAARITKIEKEFYEKAGL